eukprot:352986-Chlamydomonas_euryale.AAC.14
MCRAAAPGATTAWRMAHGAMRMAACHNAAARPCSSMSHCVFCDVGGGGAGVSACDTNRLSACRCTRSMTLFKPNFRGQFVAGRPPIVGSQVRIEADGSCASVWERGQARASLCNRVLGGSHGGERGWWQLYAGVLDDSASGKEARPGCTKHAAGHGGSTLHAVPPWRALALAGAAAGHHGVQVLRCGWPDTRLPDRPIPPCLKVHPWDLVVIVGRPASAA